MKNYIYGFIGLVFVLFVFTGCSTLTINEQFYNAAHAGNIGEAQQLLQKGAAINHRHSRVSGASALHTASARGHLHIVRFLIERGADINIRSDYGWTPLMDAAYHGHFDVVRYLVERGADINLRDNFGGTALSEAHDRGNLQIHNYLRERGAIEFAPIQRAQQTAPAPAPQQTQQPQQPQQPAMRTFMVTVFYETPAGARLSMPYTVRASSAQEAQILGEGRWRNSNFGNNRFLYSSVSGGF